MAKMQSSDLRPMLATLIESPFDDKEWVFETKWDGFRLVAKARSGRSLLYSRGGNDVTAQYPSVAQALQGIRRKVVLDGELVALDARSHSRFQLLQNALKGDADLRYYVFDLLFLDDRDLRGEPLIERKRRLRAL